VLETKFIALYWHNGGPHHLGMQPLPLLVIKLGHGPGSGGKKKRKEGVKKKKKRKKKS